MRGEKWNMTEGIIARTSVEDSRAAGYALGKQITEKLFSEVDVVIVFASSHYDFSLLLHSLKEACHPRHIVGCSSSGEFATGEMSNGSACAVALHSTDMHFAVGYGLQLKTYLDQAVQDVVASLEADNHPKYSYRSILLLMDGLSGCSGDFLDLLVHETRGAYQVFGVIAGDDREFCHTPVFCETQVLEDAVVVLEILSYKPIGIGVQHGWSPASQSMHASRVEGRRILQIDGRPAVEAFQTYADETGQVLDHAAPGPFFARNILGLERGNGYQLRAPVRLERDGSVWCASELPEGVVIRFMKSTEDSVTRAAENATTQALQKLY
jgi:hypothetical protein